MSSDRAPVTAGPAASARQGIDPRGPRFGAAITATLLLLVVVLAVAGAAPAAFWLLVAITLLFAWGAIAGIRRHPFGLLFAKLVRPRLAPPAELEDPRPPTFAQGVGFAVAFAGVILALLGVSAAVPIAAAIAFLAAFLNAVFGFCLGCQVYLLLARARILPGT
ncbi:DUF4395 domain-containing protein [Agromyces badenianii]|uniref:DUF4395 domain-containing protein n=1 Tax=Agromyces badenianii TaxID=2080742 RepID=UPI000D59FEA7|nr:DUF4395 domain-containing protein [Agromyces badenianii]PWC03274.1 DUF4395 domain-containing protein [Agromyces badenianii]